MRPLRCILTACVNARQRVLHIHEPTNQSVLEIWIGHFDWLAHEYALTRALRTHLYCQAVYL